MTDKNSIARDAAQAECASLDAADLDARLVKSVRVADRLSDALECLTLDMAESDAIDC